ncbi:MAG: hypothetical protein JXA46_18620 [Dehalococcoidales bacterium]|nr:hypothetical protein [Dehalococcoidales bacterium]
MKYRSMLFAAAALFLLLSTFCGSTAAGVDEGIVISVSPVEQTVNAGETITVDLVVDTGSTQMRGWQGGVIFDSGMLECLKVEEGDFLKEFDTGETYSPLEPQIDNEYGEVADICYIVVSQEEGGVSGSGVLCTLTFRVDEYAAGLTEIDLIEIIVAGAGAREIEDVTLEWGTININPIYRDIVLGIYPEDDDDSVYKGDSFDLEVWIDTSEYFSSGAGLGLTYDPDEVYCEGVEEGGFFSDGYDIVIDPDEPVIDNDEGRVEYFTIALDYSSGEYQTGSGIFCIFHMKAGSETGTATISIGDCTVLDDEGNEYAGITVDPDKASIKVRSSSSGGGGGGGGGGGSSPPATTPPTTTTAPSPSPTPVVSETPSPVPEKQPSPSPSRTSETAPEKSPVQEVKPSTQPAVTAAEKTETAVPVSPVAAGITPEPSVKPEEEISMSGAEWSFDLRDLLDPGGELVDDYTVEKVVNRDGIISLSLKIDSGTEILNRQGRPLDSIIIEKIEPSESLREKIAPAAVFECGPYGSTLSAPVVVVMRYDSSALPEKVTENDLKIAIYDAKNVEWVVLDSRVDVINHTISAEIDRFATLALVEKAGKGLNWIIFVIVGAVVVIAAAVIFWFLRRKRPGSAIDASSAS